MGLADLFVPKYQNSNPKVRIKFIHGCNDLNLLKQMSEKDKDADVIQAAKDRIKELKPMK